MTNVTNKNVTITHIIRTNVTKKMLPWTSLITNKLGLSWGSTRLRQLAWSYPAKLDIVFIIMFNIGLNIELNIGLNIGLNVAFIIEFNIGFNIGLKYWFQYWDSILGSILHSILG